VRLIGALVLLLATQTRAEDPQSADHEAWEDCGLVAGETYRIGRNTLQLPDGRVITGWSACDIPVGVRFSLWYDEVPEAPPATTQKQQDPTLPAADKTPIPSSGVSQMLDSSAQAASVASIVSFLSKHPEVILLEVRVTGPCLADGSEDPIVSATAADLASVLRAVGIPQERARVVSRQCVPGGKGVRIEAVVVRTQK